MNAQPQAASTPADTASPPPPRDLSTPRDTLAGGSPPGRRRRTGKIACLPKQLRDQINLLIQDGLPYRLIVDKLQSPGASVLPYAISEHNLSEWKDGGYQDWLKDQFWQNEMRARQEAFTSLLAGADPIQLPEGGLQIAATGICELLRDLCELSNTEQPDPDKLVRVANSLSRLSRSILQLQLYRDTRARAEAAELKRLDPGREFNEAESQGWLDRADDLFGFKSAQRLNKKAECKVQSPDCACAARESVIKNPQHV